ncbi:hypothetical protein L1987_89464 [Smallanthus sonchifolius]|nr:hypothetical protein L1987_89464 [Smallanthus sonchifolius]
MRKGAASGRAGGMDERKVSCHGVGNIPSLIASLFVMGNQCSGPNRAYTWLSPAHISLAALNRPVCLPLWRPPYLTPATLSLQATPAEQDALRFPLLWTHL